MNKIEKKKINNNNICPKMMKNNIEFNFFMGKKDPINVN